MTAPIKQIIRFIDAFNKQVGNGVAWIALALVLVQFVVVILRYVFAIGFIPMQESIWYMHGVLFMLGAGYTLLQDGHVRVDIFYRDTSTEHKAWVDLCGVVFFLTPVCIVAWWLSWSYVANAWQIREGSIEISGLPYIYLLKTVILGFIFLIFIQGISVALKAFLVLRESPQNKSNRD